MCSRSSNTIYKHSWTLSFDMLYPCLSRHCTRILTQITYQKSMRLDGLIRRWFLWVRWAWYPPFTKESILESFGDDRSPDGSPSNFWDEPTVLLDSTPASRRMSSRRTFAQCLEFKWVPHDTPDIFCGIGIQPPAGECPHLPRRRQVAWS